MDNTHNDFDISDSFFTISNEWLDTSESRLKYSSYTKYRNILYKYLQPQYGIFSISEIDRSKVSNYIAELLSSGGPTGNGLAPKTVADMLNVLKNIFSYASKTKGINTVDLSGIYVKQKSHLIRVLSFVEQERLNEYLYSHLDLRNLGILVCLYTGIRIGEICALKWQDILIDEQCIYVHQTMQRLQTKKSSPEKTTIIVSDPKSVHSMRNIPLPDALFKLILNYKHPIDTYFLTGKSDVFTEPRTMQNHFKTVMKKNNIQGASFHSLRHTFATRCIELGFDIKSLSEILGHSSVNITLNRYVHPSMELKKQNMNRLSKLLKTE